MDVTNIGRTLDDIRYPGEQRLEADSLDQQDFLRLMVEQMRHQNPMEPKDNSEFISQIAQFDTLTAMREMVTAVQTLAEVNGLANAAALIGRNVTASLPQGADPETGMPRPNELVSGTVERVTFEGGKAVVHVGDRGIPSEHVLEVQ